MERGCPSCGRMIDANSKKCPYCNYDLTQLNSLFKHYESEADIKIPKYAGFIKRMAANSIDWLLMFVIFTIIEGIYVYFFITPVINDISLESVQFIYIIKLIIPYLCMLFVYFFYCVFTQCSKFMGTLGQRFIGIEVVDDLESPLTFGLAFKRNFLRILNVLTCGIGTLMIIFTKNKQSLGDIASHTFVLNRLTNEQYGGFSYAHLFKRLLAFIIDIIVLYGIYVLFGYLHEFVTGLNIEIKSTILNILPVIMIFIMCLYFPYTEARNGSSIGKLIMKLKVKTLNNEKPKFFRSLFRFISFIIELIILPFGTLLAFVTPRKQTFKDLLSKTVVVNKY
ncbi:MAG: RDD family protein [Bacilli bacterium]|nr:RDD family protein [Bacilli bacterium]